ncbi:MAG: multiheme c-type cytochrome [Isosphaeraceae bacterium]
MTESAEGTGPNLPGSKPVRGEAAWIAAVGLALAVAVFWWAYTPSQTPPGPASTRKTAGARPTSGFVGARACKDCHPGEYAAYTSSGHARTLRPAAKTDLARWLDSRTADDSERPGASWTFQRDGDRLIAQPVDGEGVGRVLLDYAFGSGKHAMTFLSMRDEVNGQPRAKEYRLSYFHHKDAMDLTPGQRRKIGQPDYSPSGRELTVELTFKCFECHTTRTSDRSATELDLATLIPNVSCERCHGPGRAHVDAARRGEGPLAMPFGPESWTANELSRSCGECHRLAEMAPASAIRAGNSELVRFQTIGLLQSACYRRSEGRLSCATCHEPHSRTSTNRPAYMAICLDCHEGPSRAVCPVSPRDGCLDCHMPRQDAGNGMLFTDHWIRAEPEEIRPAP